MSVNTIVQVRMGSSRLPGKALLPLAGKPLFAHVLEALSLINGVQTRIAAMPANSEKDLAPIARSYGWKVFVGSEDDVLGRFAAACEAYPAEHIIRATADNPMVSYKLGGAILRRHISRGADISHYLGIPSGAGVEVVRCASLMQAAAESVSPHEREHVTPYLYAHRQRFAVYEPECSGLPDISLTVDTPEDYQRANRIFTALYAGKPLPLRGILALFNCTPELFTTMNTEEQQ